MTTTRTILLVEKEPIIAIRMSDLLRTAGYEVVHVTGSEQARASFAAGSPTQPGGSNQPGKAAAEGKAETAIDLALISIHLSTEKLDGLQLAQEVRQQWNIPVVFLSAYSDPQLLAQAEAISPYGYLLQPVNQAELIATLRQAFRLHAALGAQKAAEQALEQAGKEYELLLREQRRRISDSLAMAASLLDLSVEELPDEQARRVFYHARARLRPFIALYDPLNRRGEGRTEQERIDMAAYFLDLTADLAHFYDWVSYRVNLTTQVDDLLLQVRQARSLGLVLIELLVHVFDYAYPPGVGGTVRVMLERTAYGALLKVYDDGTTARPALPEMSRTLIEYLAKPMAGRFTYEISSYGVTASLAFRITE